MRARSLKRALACAVLALLVLPSTAIGQSGPAGPPAKQTPPKSSPPPKAAPSKPPADPNVPEREFTITAMDSTKIKCTVFPNTAYPGKIVRFDPHLPQTETNIYSASLNSMWEIYGRQRGTFNMNDASLATRPGITGNVVVYKLRSGAKFCVYAVRDDASRSLTEMKVWME